MTVISWVCSLPRTFDTLSKLASLSAFFTFISVLLAAIFAGIEAHPAGYNPDPNYVDPITGTAGGPPIVLVVPAAGTTFVAGLNAFMNISYTFIGQITLPSFIAEMRNPVDFPKALWAVTIAEIILFSLVGAVVYAYTGTNYNTVRYILVCSFAMPLTAIAGPGFWLPRQRGLQESRLFIYDSYFDLSR